VVSLLINCTVCVIILYKIVFCCFVEVVYHFSSVSYVKGLDYFIMRCIHMFFDSKRRFLRWFFVFVVVGAYFAHRYQRDYNARKVAQKVTSNTIFAFLGAPGSGKGTLAEKLSDQLDFRVVSTGNLCREEIASGSEKGQMIASYLKNAQLVPDEVIADMVDAWLCKHADGKPIILDGYPRTQNQAALLLHLLRSKYANVYHFRVVSLEIDDLELIVQRIANRVVCSNKACQATYNRTLLKDPSHLVCERCGEALTQRADDKEDIVRKRLVEFKNNNDAIKEFFEQQGVAVESIMASRTPAEAFEAFQLLL
jgi:adenylate kinase